MPYFEKYNILFIHIPKNAGMYIEKLLGIPHYIVSYRKPTDQKNILEIFSGLFSGIKFLLQKDNPHYLTKRFKNTSKKYRYGSFGGFYYYQHASLWEIVNYRILDKNVLDSCIILAVHRNPLDRLVSIYNYWGFYKEISFEKFCDNYVKNRIESLENFGLLMHLKSQYSFIADAYPYSEKVEWLALEDLENDLKRFCHKYNIKLNFLEKTVNVSHAAIDVCISSKSKSLIYEIYKKDFEYFGYKI